MEPRKQYLPLAPNREESAIQIFQTCSDISTPEDLANVISNKNIAKYRDIPRELRRKWIGSQIYALGCILHYQVPAPTDVKIDSAFADQMIMDDSGLQALTQVEMQEAFRRGIAKEYGEFYGITAATLVGFLKGFRSSAKRQEAISILYAREQEQIEAEKKKEARLMYELKAHNLELPFWRSSREKKQVSKEESEAHRRKIEQQREEIFKAQHQETL